MCCSALVSPVSSLTWLNNCLGRMGMLLRRFVFCAAEAQVSSRELCARHLLHVSFSPYVDWQADWPRQQAHVGAPLYLCFTYVTYTRWLRDLRTPRLQCFQWLPYSPDVATSGEQSQVNGLQLNIFASLHAHLAACFSFNPRVTSTTIRNCTAQVQPCSKEVAIIRCHTLWTDTAVRLWAQPDSPCSL